MNNTYNFEPYAHNTLIAKIYTAALNFDFSDYDLSIRYNKTEHKIVMEWGDFSADIVVLDAGVDPNKWATDGRRNWRPVRRVIEQLINSEHEKTLTWMFEADEDGSLLGEVSEVERIIREYPATILDVDHFVEPYGELDYARHLDPLHPLIERYEVAHAELLAIVADPAHEPNREFAQIENDARLAREKEARRRMYIEDAEYRAEKDAAVVRFRTGPFRMTDEYEDLREIFANGGFSNL